MKISGVPVEIKGNFIRPIPDKPLDTVPVPTNEKSAFGTFQSLRLEILNHPNFELVAKKLKVGNSVPTTLMLNFLVMLEKGFIPNSNPNSVQAQNQLIRLKIILTRFICNENSFELSQAEIEFLKTLTTEIGMQNLAQSGAWYDFCSQLYKGNPVEVADEILIQVRMLFSLQIRDRVEKTHLRISLVQ